MSASSPPLTLKPPGPPPCPESVANSQIHIYHLPTPTNCIHRLCLPPSHCKWTMSSLIPGETPPCVRDQCPTDLFKNVASRVLPPLFPKWTILSFLPAYKHAVTFPNFCSLSFSTSYHHIPSFFIVAHLRLCICLNAIDCSPLFSYKHSPSRLSHTPLHITVFGFCLFVFHQHHRWLPCCYIIMSHSQFSS